MDTSFNAKLQWSPSLRLRKNVKHYPGREGVSGSIKDRKVYGRREKRGQAAGFPRGRKLEEICTGCGRCRLPCPLPPPPPPHQGWWEHSLHLFLRLNWGVPPNCMNWFNFMSSKRLTTRNISFQGLPGGKLYHIVVRNPICIGQRPPGCRRTSSNTSTRLRGETFDSTEPDLPQNTRVVLGIMVHTYTFNSLPASARSLRELTQALGKTPL